MATLVYLRRINKKTGKGKDAETLENVFTLPSVSEPTKESRSLVDEQNVDQTKTIKTNYNPNHYLTSKSFLRHQQYVQSQQAVSARKAAIAKSELKETVENAAAKILMFEKQMDLLRHYNINMTTFTITSNLNVHVDIIEFAKDLVLKRNKILMVKYAQYDQLMEDGTLALGYIVMKTIVQLFDETKRKRPTNPRDSAVQMDRRTRTETKNFYSQISMLVQIDPRYFYQDAIDPNNPNMSQLPVISNKKIAALRKGFRRPQSLKLFCDGKLQGTGSVNVSDFYHAVNIVIEELRNPPGKYITYIADPLAIRITETKVQMINSNFYIGQPIDIYLLAKILKVYHHHRSVKPVKNRWRPSGGQSCLSIKFYYDDRNVTSIFLFQSGEVVATGAKKIPHLTKAFEYLKNNVLKGYEKYITYKQIDQKDIINSYKHWLFMKSTKAATNQQYN